jgi:hypothetical protein
MNFSKRYPHIAWWIDNHGWIEIGTDEYSDSLIRLIDIGGVWWEDEEETTIDKALDKAEKFLIDDLPQRFGSKFTLNDNK